ncbi:MAG: hypothetical protein HDS56_03120 [Barnesiella sp.]|nr:hypothetical protein [Barnesiella sp.]MBD5343409.1 hypothetical protein [Bacteroides sp.]MBD5343426.1 hypothetical protein [Bacteroides sp.]MBD5344253.1 hypothetical protein [Bacteroides sp.]MBD5345463.1 hypothetical protein [Bacteroides sp.]
MAKEKRYKSTLARAEKVKAITALHYEAGNQAKCYKAIWRRWIEPEFGICYQTYINLLGISPIACSNLPQNQTPSLFDDL